MSTSKSRKAFVKILHKEFAKAKKPGWFERLTGCRFGYIPNDDGFLFVIDALQFEIRLDFSNRRHHAHS